MPRIKITVAQVIKPKMWVRYRIDEIDVNAPLIDGVALLPPGAAFLGIETERLPDASPLTVEMVGGD